MNSVAEYIIERTGLFAWTEDDPLLQRYNNDFVMYVIFYGQKQFPEAVPAASARSPVKRSLPPSTAK